MEEIREAKATAGQRGKTFYHGTASEADAKAIMAEGLAPPDLSGSNESLLRPVEGKVYLTPDPGYALIYAIGGNIVGSEVPRSFIEKDGRYGYVFLVRGEDLQDVQPDEDAIGEMLADNRAPDWLVRKAKAIMAPSTFRKVMEGDYCWGAKAGKMLLKRMSDAEVSALLDADTAVAHHGGIKPFAAYRVDKERCRDLKHDGSNIADVCERIDLPLI